MKATFVTAWVATLITALATPATAQLRPPVSTDEPRLSAPATGPQQAAKEEAAQAAAERWLGLLDRGAWGEAWEQCAKLFRDRVPRDEWAKNIPVTRAPFGKVKTRRSELSVYKQRLPGVPDGEYVTVRFSTDFENKADAEELVTMTYEGGAWRPTGYFIR